MSNINELKLAKDLIRFPSITPEDAGAINFLSKQLRSLGFNCKILEFKDRKSKPIKNLYARLGKKAPNLCYAGHTDVVPPGNIKDWTIDPFKPSIRKNHLIGRGANDMKSSIACFVSAVNKFLQKKPKFNGSISFLITGDEEGLAINGTKKVVDYLKKIKEKIDFCIVGEPTNPNKLGEMIKIGRRGSLTGKIVVSGTQGHVAYPHLSNNPINTLISICKKLKEKKLDKGNKNFQPSNLEFTAINVNNEAHNVIPSRANAQFNIRYNNFHTAVSLKKKINLIIKTISKKNKCNFKIEYIANGDSFLTKPERTIYMAREIIKKITKITPEFSTTGGTSDARFIRKISPCLEFGLVNKTMHKVDECVSLSDLKKLTSIYQNILLEFFK
ncbi:succinyl-diaminopimelate desuccinylase [Pelagibacteraceae bacterium]|nr:succinyl-diaminopimelate desuccinylase [Pelagibacteraceae bacterium]MDC0339865.1 succinyl-diaminopimelate desuccinylase [Pelagibacteraceae bacterium]MDC0366538.1 succinyl-diaminopimelate desuccinylase [Pelagibacteraceae bacterium]